MWIKKKYYDKLKLIDDIKTKTKTNKLNNTINSKRI